MKIAVAGLGLIGGSLAKAFTEVKDVFVYGHDISREVLLSARLIGAMDDTLTKENIKECDYIFIALYPDATNNFLKEYAPFIKKGAVCVDCGGIKRSICKCGFELAKKYGFRFIGGHPMAGTHFSGIKYSRASLFDKASMVLCPDNDEKIETLERLKSLLCSAGFKSISITTPENHDSIISYTSQLAHVVSNAYVKSPSAKVHKGFSAGSYRDLTRVAKLNPDMWTELFIENRDNLSRELTGLIEELEKYNKAIKEKDRDTLNALLSEGTKIKESIG